MVDGNIPLRRTGGEAGDVSDESALPGISSSEASLDLKLEAVTDEGVELVVSSNRGVHTADVGKDYLTRWWVNGEAFVPEGATVIGERRPREELPPSGDQHRFTIEFEPAQIGAKRGDRVELQLLYFPDGTPLSEGRSRVERIVALQRLPELTNRIAFTAR